MTSRTPPVCIDAHVHVFPDRLAERVRATLGARGVPFPGGPLLADVAASVTAAGFDHAWALPYAHRAGVAEAVNEWSATEVTRYPSLIPGATFHPDDPNLDRLVGRALSELRLRVVKLHCSVGKFLVSDPRLDPLWELAAALEVPVVVHAGHSGPGETLAEEVAALARPLSRYPNLRLVVAHTGFPNIDAVVELMARFEHLHADLTPVWDSRVMISPSGLDRLAGRVLFGSDAPNNPTAADAQRDELLGWLPAHHAESVLFGAAAALCPVRG